MAEHEAARRGTIAMRVESCILKKFVNCSTRKKDRCIVDKKEVNRDGKLRG
jgi:hypothetical protein